MVSKKSNLLTKEMRVELPHPVFMLPRRVLVRVVAPRDLDERDAMTPENPLLAIQDVHGLLLDGQAVVQLQLRIIQHVRWVRDVFPEHGHMKIHHRPQTRRAVKLIDRRTP